MDKNPSRVEDTLRLQNARLAARAVLARDPHPQGASLSPTDSRAIHEGQEGIRALSPLLNPVNDLVNFRLSCPALVGDQLNHIRIPEHARLNTCQSSRLFQVA